VDCGTWLWTFQVEAVFFKWGRCVPSKPTRLRYHYPQDHLTISFSFYFGYENIFQSFRGCTKSFFITFGFRFISNFSHFRLWSEIWVIYTISFIKPRVFVLISWRTYELEVNLLMLQTSLNKTTLRTRNILAQSSSVASLPSTNFARRSKTSRLEQVVTHYIKMADSSVALQPVDSRAGK
jgi:hypothetical protein